MVRCIRDSSVPRVRKVCWWREVILYTEASEQRCDVEVGGGVSLRESNDVGGSDGFLGWGRTVANGVASRLEDAIVGARRGPESHLDGYEAVYVHLRDA